MDVLSAPSPVPSAPETKIPVSIPEFSLLHQRTGQGAIGVEFVADQSALTHLSSATPLKVLVPKTRGLSVWSYLSTYGGGIVAGDQTRLSVKVGPQARLFLGSQSSTKVYKHPSIQTPGSSHETVAHLADDALLVAAPEPLQAFADSVFSQSQVFHLAPTSNLALLDWYCSGRVARGEFWTMQKLVLKNRIFRKDQWVLHDAVHLERNTGELPLQERFGRMHVCGTFLFMGPLLIPAIDAFLSRQSDGKGRFKRDASLVWSYSRLGTDGLLIRFASEHHELAQTWLKPIFADLAPLLGDDPWIRRI